MSSPFVTVAVTAQGQAVPIYEMHQPTYALDALSTASKTASPITNRPKPYHIANTVFVHVRMDGSDATTTDALLAPGERQMLLPANARPSVIKAAGEVDGIVRITELR